MVFRDTEQIRAVEGEERKGCAFTSGTGSRTISIIMPALNEEGNIENSIDTAISSAMSCFDDFEIIVVNDGSSDRTLEIVEKKAANNNKIRIISHPKPMGFGASFHTGRKNAKMKYSVMVQGDNPFNKETLKNFFSHTSKSQIVCGYIANVDFRPWTRQVISSLYTRMLNFLLGLNLRYYNGPQIYETAWLRKLDLENSGFGFQAEVLVTALREGKSYIEVPVVYAERLGGGTTKIFKPRNIISVIGTVLRLMRIKKVANSG
jgi:glycosyltransferase involved in cell wall biosynthesis